VAEPDGVAPRGRIPLSPKSILNIHRNLSALWTWAVRDVQVHRCAIHVGFKESPAQIPKEVGAPGSRCQRRGKHNQDLKRSISSAIQPEARHGEWPLLPAMARDLGADSQRSPDQGGAPVRTRSRQPRSMRW
jgi:hypothetical protein